MNNAMGSSDREMEIVKQSLTYKLNTLKETWVGVVQDLLKRDDLGIIVDGLTKISEAVGSVIGNLGLLKTAATGIVGYLSFKNVGEWNYISKFRSNNIICLLFECADSTV